MKNQICTILGGGGFIGRYLVRNLTKKNYRCIITTRKSFQKGYLKTQATPGSIELFTDRNEYVIVCHHGIRSRTVALYLEQKGVKANLYNLSGGMDQWSDDVDSNIKKYK